MGSSIKVIINKLKSVKPNEVAGLVGDLADLEMIYSFKNFFEEMYRFKKLRM